MSDVKPKAARVRDDNKANSKSSARHESVFASLRDDGKLHEDMN